MVEELHIARKPADIGFYSGLVVCQVLKLLAHHSGLTKHVFSDAASKIAGRTVLYRAASDNLPLGPLIRSVCEPRPRLMHAHPNSGYRFSKDRLGRKPIILSGLTGVALATAGFGLSTTFWQALVFRAMAGGLTGNIA